MSASSHVCRLHASCTDRVTDIVEIVAVAGGEVVETDDVLAEAQQRLEQMRSDESGAARDEPAQRLPAQLGARCRVRAGLAVGFGIRVSRPGGPARAAPPGRPGT